MRLAVWCLAILLVVAAALTEAWPRSDMGTLTCPTGTWDLWPPAVTPVLVVPAALTEA